MEKKISERGFGYFEFEDLYGTKCSLQESSLATKDAIWLGIDDAKPQIMCSDARRLGVRGIMNEPEANNGWCDFEIPKEVLLTTRMHLDKEQAKELVRRLRVFIKTGNL